MSNGAPSVAVGNDVVDMMDPRLAGKTDDLRFVQRVLSRSERQVLADATDPGLELWCIWAAKEAAYKSVSKRRSEPPVFSHASFVVRWTDAATPPGACDPIRSGHVRFEGSEVDVVVTRSPGALHALAHASLLPEASCDVRWGLEPLDSPGASWHGALPDLITRLSARERTAVHSLPSAAVRLAAREALATAMRLDEARLEIVCDPGPFGRRPPRVYLDGRLTAADVSLSHAGRWIAWAHWVDTHSF